MYANNKNALQTLKKLLKAGKIDASIKESQSLREQHSKDADLLYRAAKLLIQKAEGFQNEKDRLLILQEAILLLDKSFSIGFFKNVEGMSIKYAETGNQRTKDSLYSENIFNNKHPYKCLRKIGDCYLLLAKKQEAERIFKLLFDICEKRFTKSNKYDFEDEFIYFCERLAFLEFDSGQLDKALEYCKKANSVTNQLWWISCQLMGDIYMKKLDYERALISYDDALCIYHKTTSGWEDKGKKNDYVDSKRTLLIKRSNALWKLKNYEEYIKIFVQLKEEYPENSEAYAIYIQIAENKIVSALNQEMENASLEEHKIEPIKTEKDDDVFDENICEICYDSRNKKSNSFTCMHTVCKDCFDKILARSKACPFCRREMNIDDNDEKKVE